MKRLCGYLLVGMVALGAKVWGAEPEILYLSWIRDPLTTMVVQWILPDNDFQELVFCRDEAHASADAWIPAFARRQLLPDRKHAMFWVEITGLKPGHSYSFRLGKEGPVHRFRTMPEKPGDGVRFAVGGDVFNLGAEAACTRMNRAIAERSPYFVAMGGDLAYSTDKLGLFGDQASHWYGWLRLWTKDMVTPEGYMIPLLAIIGNHDVLGRYDQTPKQAPYYYDLFLWPGEKGYGALDIGDYMTLVGLDTGHTHPIAGEQARWLKKALRNRLGVRHKFAVYHVPAYSSREADFRAGRMGPLVRKHWVPLFDAYHLTAAFEHHEHVYKRTHPIKHDKIDPEGTLYLGDGGWAVKVRKPLNPERAWYLAKTASANHGILVTLSTHERRYQAISIDGEVIDETVQVHDPWPVRPLSSILDSVESIPEDDKSFEHS